MSDRHRQRPMEKALAVDQVGRPACAHFSTGLLLLADGAGTKPNPRCPPPPPSCLFICACNLVLGITGAAVAAVLEAVATILVAVTA